MRFLLLVTASLLALSGCHGKTDPPGEAPANVTAQAGDGVVLLTWDMLPDLTYWIFFQAGSDVTAAQPGAIALRNVVSPRAVGPLQNETQYAFVMNATHADSAAGPSSPVVLRKPRLAGDSNTWVSGTALGTAPQNPNLRALAFSGSRFVAVGDAIAGVPTIFFGDYNYASAAPNPGVTAWTAATTPPPGFSGNLGSIVFNGTFVALGPDGSVVSSADGLTWALSSVAVPAQGVAMNGIAFALISGVAPTYVAVGNGASIFTTPDILTTQWTLRAVSAITTSDLTSIILLNGTFFVTGASGTILTSTDGVNWNLQNTAGTTSTLRGIAFSAPLARYVAVGDAATVITSTDGTNWVPATVPSTLTQNLTSVTVGGASGTRFIAVGQGGAVAYSDTGTDFQQAASGASLSKVVSAPAMYLGVGDAGANAVSK